MSAWRLEIHSGDGALAACHGAAFGGQTLRAPVLKGTQPRNLCLDTKCLKCLSAVNSRISNWSWLKQKREIYWVKTWK